MHRSGRSEARRVAWVPGRAHTRSSWAARSCKIRPRRAVVRSPRSTPIPAPSNGNITPSRPWSRPCRRRVRQRVPAALDHRETTTDALHLLELKFTDVARAAAIIGLVAASSGRPALALTPKLTASQSARAVADGAALATAGQGYPMSQYRLWAAQDTLSIAPGQGALDALVIATPFERLRYESYLNGYQHKRIRPATSGSTFGPTPIRWNSSCSCTVQAASSATSLTTSGTPPSHWPAAGRCWLRSTTGLDRRWISTTSRGAAERLRWIGYVGARFDLRHVSATARTLRGTLSFVDDEGKHYRFPFDLSRYK